MQEGFKANTLGAFAVPNPEVELFSKIHAFVIVHHNHFMSWISVLLSTSSHSPSSFLSGATQVLVQLIQGL